MALGTKNDLLSAPIVGCCAHVAFPGEIDAYGRVWQGQGAAVLCRRCFDGARREVVKARMTLGISQGLAERWFTAHSVHN